MDDTTRTHEEEKDLLEEMVDAGHLANVLDALAEVCHEKAAHLESAWDDTLAAASWTRAAKRIETLSARTEYPFLNHIPRSDRADIEHHPENAAALRRHLNRERA